MDWSVCFDFQDNGDEFYYTGSGGRDLSGNKRTAEQSCDQKLTRMNRFVKVMVASLLYNTMHSVLQVIWE